MYLGWPEYGDAYSHDRQYTLGNDLLIAPVAKPGDPATKEVWFPPGRWIDIFTGQAYKGPAVRTLQVPLERMPVFAPAGAMLPLQEYRPAGDTTPPDRLVIEAFPGRRGAFTLYEDQGDGLAYRQGRSARTQLSQRRRGGGVVVTIGRARGRYAGQPRRRAYELRILGTARPHTVTIGGRRVPHTTPGAARGWWYAPGGRTVFVRGGRLRTASAVRVVVR
jgi:alpha-glucosidase (family GH31 glycosyl hydrolase)